MTRVSQLTVNQLSAVLTWFNLTREEFEMKVNEGKVEFFSDYKSYFIWQHEELEKSELIELLYQETNHIGLNHVVLDDQSVVYVDSKLF